MGTTLVTITVPATVGAVSAGVAASAIDGQNRTFNISGLLPGDTIAIEGANADLTGYYAPVLRISYSGTPASTVTLFAENSQWYRARRIAKGANVVGTGRSVSISGNLDFELASNVEYLDTPPLLNATNVQAAVDVLKTYIALADLNIGSSIYGGGEDGAVPFDGVSVVLGLTPVLGVYTLNHDVFLGGGTRVFPGVTVRTGGNKIFCNGTLTNDGSIVRLGNNAVGATAGAASTLGTLGIGTAGGNGRVGVGAGTAGSGQSNGLGDAVAMGHCAGGAGGTAGAQAGGAGGTYAAFSAGSGGANYLFTDMTGFMAGQTSGGNQAQMSIVGGGSGGGGGGSASAGASGGGGGGAGGPLHLCVYNLVNNGQIYTVGGDGAAASGIGDAGGGGGGGGGVILSTSRYRSGSGTMTAPGGLKGAGLGAGLPGVDGYEGHVNMHTA